MSFKSREDITKLKKLVAELEDALNESEQEPDFIRITDEKDGIRFEGKGSPEDIFLLLTKSMSYLIEEMVDLENREKMIDETCLFMKEFIEVKKVKVEKGMVN